MKSKNWPESFGHALRGIVHTIKNERNFRIQMIFGILTVIACIILRVETWQFALVIVAIFFVLATELINTAVEAIADLCTKGEFHPLAKTAKDAAAGAVLLASVFAVVVGAVVAVSVIRGFLQ